MAGKNIAAATSPGIDLNKHQNQKPKNQVSVGSPSYIEKIIGQPPSPLVELLVSSLEVWKLSLFP